MTRQKTSRYRGVDYNNLSKTFRARIMVGNQQIHLGVFKTENEAAIVYNNNALKYFGSSAILNEIETKENKVTNSETKGPIARRINTTGTSQFRGVYYHKATKKWGVSVYADRKTHYIGAFDDEIEAARIYNINALRLIGDAIRPYLNKIPTEKQTKKVEQEPFMTHTQAFEAYMGNKFDDIANTAILDVNNFSFKFLIVNNQIKCEITEKVTSPNKISITIETLELGSPEDFQMLLNLGRNND